MKIELKWNLITPSMAFKQVLLLDEVTVDLDVVARLDLLDFFKEECEEVRNLLLIVLPEPKLC